MGNENIDELLRRRDELLENQEMDELLRRRDKLLASRERPDENFYMDVLKGGFGVSQFSDNYSKKNEKWESLTTNRDQFKLNSLIQQIHSAKYMVFVKQTDSWTNRLESAIGAATPFYMWILTSRLNKTKLFLNLFDVKILNIMPRLGPNTLYAGFDIVEIKFSDSSIL